MLTGRDESDALRKRWEDRASGHGNELVSVLFKGFSGPLNRYIHRWHVKLLARHLLPQLAHGARVLDLGCGYGRLSQELRRIRPDLQMTGLDFSAEYCRRYRDALGADVACGDLRHLPFRAGGFDAVLAIVALMYVAPDEAGLTMDGIMRQLRPGGVAMFLDPGAELLALAGRVLPASAAHSTGGHGFRLAEYRRLARSAGAAVLKEGGNLGFTLLLPLLRLLPDGPALTGLLKLAGVLDAGLSGLRRYALHRWMLIQSNVSAHDG